MPVVNPTNYRHVPFNNVDSGCWRVPSIKFIPQFLNISDILIINLTDAHLCIRLLMKVNVLLFIFSNNAFQRVIDCTKFLFHVPKHFLKIGVFGIILYLSCFLFFLFRLQLVYTNDPFVLSLVLILVQYYFCSLRI